MIKKWTRHAWTHQSGASPLVPSIRFLQHGTSLHNLNTIFSDRAELKPRCLTSVTGSGVSCNNKVVYFSVVTDTDADSIFSYPPPKGQCHLYLDPSLLVDYWPVMHVNRDWTAYGHKTQTSLSTLQQLQRQLATARDHSVVEVLIANTVSLDKYLRFIVINGADEGKVIDSAPRRYLKYFRAK